MEDLLKKSKINKKELKNYIFNHVATEISNLSESCYRPGFERASQELLKRIGLTEQDMKKFSSTFYESLGDKTEFYILKDPGTSTILFLMHYFLQENDKETYYYLNIFLVLKFYLSWYSRSFKTFCNPGLFDLALQHLSPNHMYSQKKGIPTALVYLARTMADKHEKILNDFNNPDLISKYVYELMNRVKQSFKSFYDMYKTLFEKGQRGFKAPKETEEGGSEFKIGIIESGIDKVAFRVIENMLVYKQVDQPAFKSALLMGPKDESLLHPIIKELGNLKYEKHIKVITISFLSKASNTSDLCGKNFVNFVSSLLAVKRSNQPIFQKEVVSLLNLIIENIGSNTYNTLSQQIKYQILKFFSFYIALYIRHVVCGKK